MPNNLWLKPILGHLREQAAERVFAGDAAGFLRLAPNEHGLNLVAANTLVLLSQGIYEAALVQAFERCRLNDVSMDAWDLEAMFRAADRRKLLQAGDPLPDGERFVLYAGAAGGGAERRPRSPAWTDSFARACWFTQRFQLRRPVVYKAEAERSDILHYSNQRGERQFIFIPEGNPNRVEILSREIRAQAAGWRAAQPAAPDSKRTRV